MIIIFNIIKINYTMIDIKRLLFDNDLSQRDLAAIMGEYQSVISLLMTGKRKLMDRHIEALIAHFGKETIDAYTIPDTPITPEVHEATVTVFDPETIEEIKEELIEEVRAEEIKKTIVLRPDQVRDPQIDLRSAYKSGELDDFAKPTQDILPCHHLKVYTYCDDMEPEIRAGEPVLVRKLPYGVDIVPGEMYFVEMKDAKKIRYIVKEEGGKYYLKARNNAYGDIVVPTSDVRSLASVVVILRTPRSMSEREATATEMLINKDRHLDRLLTEMAKGGERERMLIEHLTKER